MDCYDAQKGGASVLKVEKNLFGAFDLRRARQNRPILAHRPAGVPCMIVISALARTSRLTEEPVGRLASIEAEPAT